MSIVLKIAGWIILILMGIPVMLYRGLVLSSLWLWFVVPLGIKPIGIAQAIGISMTIALFTFRIDEKTKAEGDTTPLWIKTLGKQIITVIAITIAWWIASLIHSYM
jgi:hypothetical protein